MTILNVLDPSGVPAFDAATDMAYVLTAAGSDDSISKVLVASVKTIAAGKVALSAVAVYNISASVEHFE